ncbi:transposase family protein [Streptomyces sp. NPDC093261]|uniref:transposase family protein n=1 Tax=Streptomyces sp. NPDC093261 TaxID=3366037 RepID=UPI0037F4BC85
MRHALVVVLALTACAVLAGATSLLAVGEWIADAPSTVLEHLGVEPNPLFSKRRLPAQATVRRLLGRIDGDALYPGGPARGRTPNDAATPPSFGGVTTSRCRGGKAATAGEAGEGVVPVTAWDTETSAAGDPCRRPDPGGAARAGDRHGSRECAGRRGRWRRSRPPRARTPIPPG